MARVKGSEKTGGRSAGTENRLTADARKIFVQTLEGEVQHIQAAFEKVRNQNPGLYLELFAKYAQYFVPKKVETTGETVIKVKTPGE